MNYQSNNNYRIGNEFIETALLGDTLQVSDMDSVFGFSYSIEGGGTRWAERTLELIIGYKNRLICKSNLGETITLYK